MSPLSSPRHCFQFNLHSCPSEMKSVANLASFMLRPGFSPQYQGSQTQSQEFTGEISHHLQHSLLDQFLFSLFSLMAAKAGETRWCAHSVGQNHMLCPRQVWACILICRREVQIPEPTPNLSDAFGKG